ncbi:MAG TPA: hypothetical protein VGM39_08140 [Kofleriaceae bacterium]|jgi:hypothetical protein
MTIRTRITLLAISFSLALGPAAFAKPSDWANVVETDKHATYSKYGNSSASAAAISASSTASNDEQPKGKHTKAKKVKAPKKAAKRGKAKRHR